MPGSLKWYLSLRFPHQNHLYASPDLHMRYMFRPSHSSYFFTIHAVKSNWICEGNWWLEKERERKRERDRANVRYGFEGLVLERLAKPWRKMKFLFDVSLVVLAVSTVKLIFQYPVYSPLQLQITIAGDTLDTKRGTKCKTMISSSLFYQQFVRLTFHETSVFFFDSDMWT
jgi:hypothetical protein